MKKQEPMTDEEALKYALETLEEAEAHYTLDEEATAELHEVTHTLRSILDSYEKCSFGTLTLGEEEDAEA
tara:strand:- start:3152 stop:3361 length:210 start_codon:yes stop_codon:yes gene_type:complete